VNKEYEYFIVILTAQGHLSDGYYKGKSIAEALDKMIDQRDLKGQVKEFKWCVRREIIMKGNEL
jgi:hypothetical protein